jgi:hypothetical protein
MGSQASMRPNELGKEIIPVLERVFEELRSRKIFIGDYSGVLPPKDSSHIEVSLHFEVDYNPPGVTKRRLGYLDAESFSDLNHGYKVVLTKRTWEHIGEEGREVLAEICVRGNTPKTRQEFFEKELRPNVAELIG